MIYKSRAVSAVFAEHAAWLCRAIEKDSFV